MATNDFTAFLAAAAADDDPDDYDSDNSHPTTPTPAARFTILPDLPEVGSAAYNTPTRRQRPRSGSLPPMTPSSGPRASSPIVGTASEKRAIRRKKGQRSRVITMAKINASKAEAKQAATPDSAIPANGFTEFQMSAMDAALNSLREKGLTFRDLMFYVFDPIHKQGVTATGILNHWISSQNSNSARSEVHDWAVNYVSAEAKAEAKQITGSGFLQMMNRIIDTDIINQFSMSLLFVYFQRKASTMLAVTSSFATSLILGLSHLKDKARLSAEKVITSTLLQSLGAYNHSNNLFKRIFCLYLYATGSQRQAITVVSHLGLSESYNGIVGKKRLRKKKKKKKPGVSIPEGVNVKRLAEEMAEKTTTKGGSLRQLSDAMRQNYRTVASTGLFAGVYDNIIAVFIMSGGTCHFRTFWRQTPR
ncbi:hypothetical protein C8J56DRAFT_1053938 [Mycena floridula]|nr:hypothetical protein C8J56DRAFT_1053938 [Mycena floridula]